MRASKKRLASTPRAAHAASSAAVYGYAASGFEGAAPLLGEHTESVLDELGYDAAAITALRHKGAIPDPAV